MSGNLLAKIIKWQFMVEQKMVSLTVHVPMWCYRADLPSPGSESVFRSIGQGVAECYATEPEQYTVTFAETPDGFGPS